MLLLHVSTLSFHPQEARSQYLVMELDSFVKATAEIEEGISDVLTGTVPLILLVLTSSNDATVPYIPVNLKMLVLYPKLFLERKSY